MTWVISVVYRDGYGWSKRCSFEECARLLINELEINKNIIREIWIGNGDRT